MKRQTFLVALLIAAGCTRIGGGGRVMSEEMFAYVFAGLLETGQKSTEGGWDPARTRLAADSILVSAGVTREEYRGMVGWLNEDVTRWKSVSEETVKILEERSTGRDPRAVIPAQ